MMPAGSKWQLFVPAYLAYGKEGSGQKIAPNSTLIFELELLSTNKEKETKGKESNRLVTIWKKQQLFSNNSLLRHIHCAIMLVSRGGAL